MAQLIYNTAVTEIIEVSLFFINYEFNVNIHKLREIVSVVQQVSIQVN